MAHRIALLVAATILSGAQFSAFGLFPHATGFAKLMGQRR